MQAQGKRRPLFYGWVIVAVAFVVFAAINGVWASFAVFYVALVEEFGWSRATTAGAFSAYMAALGSTAWVAGWLADRFGPRRIMPLGSVILALGLAAASRLSEPWHLYLAYGGVIAFGHSCVGFIPHLRLLSNWFDRRRGAAFGIATSGLGLGALAILPAIQFSILSMGWRQTYLIMAAGILFLAPLTALVHRERPGDLGQLPDGDAVPDPPPATSPAMADGARRLVDDGLRNGSPFVDFGIRKAITTANFWAMFVSNICFGVATIILVLQVAHIVEVGFDPILAATISGLVGFLTAVGRLLGGIFSDSLGKAATGLAGAAILTLGVLAVVAAGFVREPSLLLAYGVLFGLGWGFFGIVGATITGYLFRGKSFGAIAGSLEIGVGIGGFVGPMLGGYLFDRLGSYTSPFAIAVAAAWLGAVCFKLAMRGAGR